MDFKIPISIRPPARKALLIAIMYKNQEGGELRTPHEDAKSWRQFLLDNYKFAEKDITMMLDDADTPESLQPTRKNILAEIDRLVKHAKPGDHLMFYFAGHSTQFPTSSESEPDGFDEALQSVNGKHILDDQLNLRMVQPLPLGACLTAIFDSCHSGTLLDLEHYDCNKIDSAALLANAPRKRDGKTTRMPQAGLTTERVEPYGANEAVDKPKVVDFKPQVEIYERKRSGKDKISFRDTFIDDLAKTDTHPRQFVIRSSTMEVKRSSPKNHCPRRTFSFDAVAGAMGKFANVVESGAKFVVGPLRMKSPERMTRTPKCAKGVCVPTGTRENPHVITFSACDDPQFTYESKRGRTMTQSLVATLRDNAHPPIRELVKNVSKDIFKHTTQPRLLFRQKQIKKWEAAGRPDHLRPTVPDGLSEPQVGSSNVLLVDEVWDPSGLYAHSLSTSS